MEGVGVSDNSGIEWTDATLNVVTGCESISSGCDLCYARTFAERWRGTPGHYFENGFDVTLRPDRLNLPLHWRKPRNIFVNSMSDLFHKDVPDEYVAQVFAVMAATPRHTFQLLTKRHGRMRSLLSSGHFQRQVLAWAHRQKWGEGGEDLPPWAWPLGNVHLGVSAEDQAAADLRVPALLETPAAVRWVSAEPLLGPVDLSRWMATGLVCGCGQAPDGAPDAHECCAECMQPERLPLGWVVVGGESGAGFRPMDIGWVRTIVTQCQAANVPVFVKQDSGRWPGRQGRIPSDLWIKEFPDAA